MKFEPAPEKVPWWVGVKGTCSRCGGKITLEEGDQALFIARDRKASYYFICPGKNCGAQIEVSRNLTTGQADMHNTRSVDGEALPV